MKKLAKKIGIGLLAGALTFLPAKKAFSLDDVVNGNIIETISETPVKSGVEIKAWEYLNGRIGDFVGEAVTDDNGDFNLNLDNNSSNYLKLEISKSDSSYYQAERYINLKDSVLLDIVNRHDVDVYNMETEGLEKMDFMEFFNSWFRAMNGCTQRWANEDEGGKELQVFIKTNLAVSSQIDSVYSIIQNKWPRFTQRVGREPLIQNTHVEQGEVIPDYAKYGTDGWTLVYWRNTGDPAHREMLDGNRIYSAAAILTPVADNRAITEELLQILGGRAETPNRFFWDINGNVLESGRRCGKTVCSRPIGNRTPDINPEPQVNIVRYIRPVTNFTVSDIPDDNGNQLELNFMPSVSENKGIVSRYRIYRGETSNINNAALIDSVLVGSTGFIDRNVPFNNKTYYYWIGTVGNVLNYVDEKANSSGETRFIDNPSDLIVEDIPDDEGKRLKLNWNEAGEDIVQLYRILRADNNNIENAALIDSVGVGTNEYIDTKVVNNKEYYYWVQAVGDGLESELINGSGISKFIEAPSNLTVSDVPDDNGHQLKLNWEKSLSEEQEVVDLYRIFRSRNVNGIERIRNINDFLRFGSAFADSINAWEESNAVLRDSVLAGNNEYIDNIPINGVPYYYWLQASGYNGGVGSGKISSSWIPPVSVDEKVNEFYLSNAYPNPFNSSVSINYQIPERCNVSLILYDINGRKVRVLEQNEGEAGSYKANWDGRDSNGRSVGNGVYLYKLNAGKYYKTEKMMLVK